MEFTYDKRQNIAYLRLADSPAEVETIQVSDDLNIDIGPTGKVYGIELLNANEQPDSLVAGKLRVKNEATGETVEVSLP